MKGGFIANVWAYINEKNVWGYINEKKTVWSAEHAISFPKNYYHVSLYLTAM